MTKRFVDPLAVAVVLVVSCTSQQSRFPETDTARSGDLVLLDNSRLRIGIDLSRGGIVSHFGDATSGRNLLHPACSFGGVQQCWRGEEDGSEFNGDPWYWNPCQGNDWWGKPAEVLEHRETPDGYYVRTRPRNWRGGELVSEVTMEQWVELRGDLARIRFRFRYDGDRAHPEEAQWMPRIVIDPQLSVLSFYSGDLPWSGDALAISSPGIYGSQSRASESWAAFVDERDSVGLGVHFPGTQQVKFFCWPQGFPSGEPGHTFLAPHRSLGLEPGDVLEYETWMTRGTSDGIRDRFAELHSTSGK